MNKPYRILPLIMVGLLSLVSIFVLIYALLHGIGKMEIGSISDWISSLSTLGTLCVAVLAYRQAPLWIAQKDYDIAHRIVEEAIYSDLPKLRSYSYDIKRNTIKFANELIHALTNKTCDPSHFKENLDIIEEQLHDFFNLSYSINLRLFSVGRYNYILSEHSNKLISELNSLSEEFNEVFENLLESESKVGMLRDDEEVAIKIAIQELRSIQSNVLGLNKNINDIVIKTHADNKPITYFIQYKKKNSNG